jgi:hypothetical protein
MSKYSTRNASRLTPGDITVGTPDILLHNISDFTWFYYIDARSVPSGVFAHEGCAVVTFQKLDCNSKSNRLEDIDQQNVITTIHMLDKVLTGENVKVNSEIAGRQHILRTLE